MSTPRIIQTGVTQGSVLSLTLFNMYVNDTPQTIGVQALLADDTCLYATERNKGYALRKRQRGLNSMLEWSKRWYSKIKTRQDKTRRRRSTSLIELDRSSLFLH
jgi:hypothetical protein